MSGDVPPLSGEGDRGDSDLRRTGRSFLLAFATLLRSLKLYPVENEQVQKDLDEVMAACQALHRFDADIELRISGDILFVNGVRLRFDTETYASFNRVLTLFQALGIGRLLVEDQVDRLEWQGFVLALLEAAAGSPSPDDVLLLADRVAGLGVARITVGPPVEDERDLDEREQAIEVAKRTYERSVAVTKEVVNGVRMGRSGSVRKVKRAVQGIVDQVLNNEISLVGLTTIRDYDEYTFTHSVNVCIFSIAIGKRLRLGKLEMYDLGMAALLHDIGKSRVPVDVLNKVGGLGEEEWQIMRSHPWMGVLTLFKLRGYGDIPYRAIVTAHEHHMKVDLSGYPKAIRPRTLSLFSKIVAVADGFDAATSRRSYQTVPIQPDQVLREMWVNPRRGFDRVIIKELINLVGIYPVGTCLILDTGEIALVHASNPDPEQLTRPLVRVVLDRHGNQVAKPDVVDLAEVDPRGEHARSILRVTDVHKYGIDPAQYFV